MTPGLQIKGLEETLRNLEIDIPKQTRFATLQTINECAKQVQKFEIETQLPSKLTLRSKGSPWWKPGTRYGINILFATRNTLRAVIGSMADWLKFQEQGGTKTASGHRLAVEAGARASERAVLTRAVKPRQLLRRRGDVTKTKTGKTRTARSDGRGFIINTKSGPAIFVSEEGGLKLMYMLEQSARIPAILNFFKSGKELVERIYPGIFAEKFKQAMATARPRQ